MPKRNSDSEKKKDLCKGGRSFNCKHYEHEKGAQINCYRCDVVMGCVRCCEHLAELICLPCNNWASRQGLRRHGDVMANEKVQHVHTDRGWRHWDETPKGPAEIIALVEDTTK